jgi:hypothetical protein
MYIDFAVPDRHHITTRFSNCDKLENGAINTRIINESMSTLLFISITRHFKTYFILFHIKTKNDNRSFKMQINSQSKKLKLSPGPEYREYGHRDPSRWPCGNLYQQTLAPTSPTSGRRSAGIVRSRT